MKDFQDKKLKIEDDVYYSTDGIETFKYLGSAMKNQNSIYEEIYCRLKAGNSFSPNTFVFSTLL